MRHDLHGFNSGLQGCPSEGTNNKLILSRLMLSKFNSGRRNFVEDTLYILLKSPDLKILLLDNPLHDSFSNKSEILFGSNRSPRRGNVVCACVRVSLSSNNEF